VNLLRRQQAWLGRAAERDLDSSSQPGRGNTPPGQRGTQLPQYPDVNSAVGACGAGRTGVDGLGQRIS
jgi:hypothetical protein